MKVFVFVPSLRFQVSGFQVHAARFFLTGFAATNACGESDLVLT